MLKRWDSAYVPGRPKGPWFKWKRDPHMIDAVLMYAQRGHGKRSSFYSDYTFGVWAGEDDAPELVPVGKAYFGFTDEELKRARPLCPQQHDRPLRPGPRGPRRAEPRAGARSRLRGAEPLDPPQVRHRHALSPHQPPALGQAAGRGGPPGDAGEAAAGLGEFAPEPVSAPLQERLSPDRGCVVIVVASAHWLSQHLSHAGMLAPASLSTRTPVLTAGLEQDESCRE